MATPFTTGPCYIWVAVPNVALAVTAPGLVAQAQRAASQTTAAAALALLNLTRTALFLGTGERAPHIRIRRKFSQVFNDIAGDQLQYDDIYEGEDALITVNLTYWNEEIYQVISSQPFSGNSPLGDGPGEIGTLMMTEGALYPLIVRFPHFNFKPSMAAQGLRPGYRFYAAGLVEDDDLEPGTGVNKRHLIWHARRVHNKDNGALVLGDFNVASIPPMPTGIAA